jgi:hypothetical protein
MEFDQVILPFLARISKDPKGLSELQVIFFFLSFDHSEDFP